MFFRALHLSEWQQFDRVNIRLHDRLTILTGVNGSGKTTVLNLLAQHAGWQNNPLATPKREPKSGVIRFLLRLFAGEDKSEREYGGPILLLGLTRPTGVAKA